MMQIGKDQPAAVIMRPDAQQVNDRGDGARTTPLVTRRCGSNSLVNGITAFAPGSRIALHFSNREAA